MKKISVIFVILLCAVVFSSCYNIKNSPFYESEWLMENKDSYGAVYYHQIFFKAGGNVTLQVYYPSNNTAVVWTGKYKISSAKLNLKMDKCVQVENGTPVFEITKRNIITYFNGDFTYALAEPGEEFPYWRMELIRPKTYFYGKNLDFMGNPMEVYCRQEK